MRVLHLVGSPVSEFYADLSRLYAADAVSALAGLPGHEYEIAWVEPGGEWRFPPDLERRSVRAASRWTPGAAAAHLSTLDVDVMVPHLFCVPGMTAYRALFEVLGIPYVGNPPTAMALGARKTAARAVVAAAGVDVPVGETLRPGELPTLAPPLVVKPADADNSLGVTLVTRPDALDAALATAFGHAEEALVEEYVPLGREVRCGVIERDSGSGTELVGLPVEEYDVDAERKPIRSYDDKIARDAGGHLHLQAKDGVRAWMLPDDDPVVPAVHAVAKACHRALGARHYSLVDLRIDPAGRPWFLEASLYCSFARQSVIVMMAERAGIGVEELFRSLVETVVAKPL